MTTDPQFKTVLVESAFETKFNTLYDPGDVSWALPDPFTLGVPATVLGKAARDMLMDPISLAELSVTIAQQDVSKVEGLDGITNSMLKNTGPVAGDSLLAMFNNPLVSGCAPSTWKKGNIAALILNVVNYRLITLISGVSKLLTKILANPARPKSLRMKFS